MARWTVTEGDQQIVIETSTDGLVTIDIPSRAPFVGGHKTVEDLRLKLGAAIADTNPECQP